MTGELERLLNSEEVGEALRIHPAVVQRMAIRGEVPGFKVGKFWRYRKSDIDEWIDSRLKSARQPCRIEN